MLHLAEEEVLLWILGAGVWPSNQVVAKDHVISAQCEGVVIARFENPLGVENGQVELSLEAHPPGGLQVQDHWEVPVRVMNGTHHDQKLIAH